MASAQFFDLKRASASYSPKNSGRPSRRPQRVLAKPQWLSTDSQWEVALGKRAESIDVVNVAAVAEPPLVLPKTTPFPLEVPQKFDEWRYKYVTSAAKKARLRAEHVAASDALGKTNALTWRCADARLARSEIERRERQQRERDERLRRQAAAADDELAAFLLPPVPKDDDSSAARGGVGSRSAGASSDSAGSAVVTEAQADAMLEDLDSTQRTWAYHSIDPTKMRQFTPAAWRQWEWDLFQAKKMFSLLEQAVQTSLNEPAQWRPHCFLLTRRIGILAEGLALMRHTIAAENWTFGVRIKVLDDRERELHRIKHGVLQCYGLLLCSAGQLHRAKRVMFVPGAE